MAVPRRDTLLFFRHAAVAALLFAGGLSPAPAQDEPPADDCGGGLEGAIKCLTRAMEGSGSAGAEPMPTNARSIPEAMPFDLFGDDDVMIGADDALAGGDATTVPVVSAPFTVTDPSGHTSTGVTTTWTFPDGSSVEVTEYDDGTVVMVDRNAEGEVSTYFWPDGGVRIASVNEDGTGSSIEVAAGLTAEDGLSAYCAELGGELLCGRPEPLPLPIDTPLITLDTERGSVSITGEGTRRSVDENGSVTEIRATAEGGTVTTHTDTDGSHSVVRRDADGQIIDQQTHTLQPSEPGREYYENVLGGTDWDTLPDSYKGRFADSERNLRTMAERQAERERQTAEAERQAAENEEWETDLARRTDEELAAIEEEGAVARAAAEARQRADARKRELAQSYERADELEAQRQAAADQGDLEEVLRIEALQDEHHAQSMELLQFTPTEQEEMERKSALRQRLAEQVQAAAASRAAGDLAFAEGVQDTKEAITGKLRWVSAGAEMQEATKRTTRMAERERIRAEAKLVEIERLLTQPDTPYEERQILREMRDMAELQRAGATQMLRDNAKLTAAGYAIDVATTATGIGLASKVATGAARLGAKAAGTVARRTLSQAAAEQLARGGTQAAEFAIRTANRGIGELAGSAGGKLAEAALGAERVATLQSKFLTARSTFSGAASAVAVRSESTARLALGDTAVDTLAATGDKLATTARNLAQWGTTDVRDAAATLRSRWHNPVAGDTAARTGTVRLSEPAAPTERMSAPDEMPSPANPALPIDAADATPTVNLPDPFATTVRLPDPTAPTTYLPGPDEAPTILMPAPANPARPLDTADVTPTEFLPVDPNAPTIYVPGPETARTELMPIPAVPALPPNAAGVTRTELMPTPANPARPLDTADVTPTVNLPDPFATTVRLPDPTTPTTYLPGPDEAPTIFVPGPETARTELMPAPAIPAQPLDAASVSRTELMPAPASPRPPPSATRPKLMDIAALERERAAARLARTQAEEAAQRAIAEGSEIPPDALYAITLDTLESSLDDRIREAQALGMPENEIVESLGAVATNQNLLLNRRYNLRDLEEAILKRAGFEIMDAGAASAVRRTAVRAMLGAMKPEDVELLARIIADGDGKGLAHLANYGSMGFTDGFEPLVSEAEINALEAAARAAALLP